MTIFYINPINGSDAAAGTSWGTAWKTFASGPTAARIAPGDEMRIAKSPDPTTVGTATWTNRKIGNSITFDTAPTKVIDTMESGFVTMGAGSTVTNAQATAFMMWGTTPGTGSTMQYVTSATTNGAYKNLGSVIDYSGYQQVCFWFRTTVALDCTGAQNFNVRLCSDTAGATPVNTLTVPKWNYAANTWYPIVIDAGSALGSNIQSVSFTTTNATTQTFYLDELFASPAGGLTLWSLIEDNDNTWYPIRTIRNADVWLMSCFSAAAATGASPQTAMLDTAWVGTTANFSTRKRETTKAYAATGPAATTWCQTNEAGTWTLSVKLLNQYRFGFNTSTDTQDGHTYIDNLIGLGTCLANTTARWRFENLIAVRFSAGISLTSGVMEWDKLGSIGCASSSLTISGLANSNTWATSSKNFEVLSITGNNAGMTISMPSAASGCGYGAIVNIGTNWGNDTVQYVGISSIVTFKNIVPAASTSSIGINFNGTSNNRIIMNKVEAAVTTNAPTGGNNGSSISIIGSCDDIFTIGSIYAGAPISISSISNSIIDIGTYIGTQSLFTGSSNPNNGNVTIRCLTNSSSNALKWKDGAGGSPDGKFYIQDYNGPGTAAIYLGNGTVSSGGAPCYFELQTGDVRTSGSKAWKYYGNGFGAYYSGMTHSIKLASVAAVANKLVTVTCYVKKNNAYQDVALIVPALFLPGYTSDIVTTYSGTPGTFQQLTITFTPTADCVFDIKGLISYVSSVAATDAVFDDLSVTQAA